MRRRGPPESGYATLTVTVAGMLCSLRLSTTVKVNESAPEKPACGVYRTLAVVPDWLTMVRLPCLGLAPIENVSGPFP